MKTNPICQRVGRKKRCTNGTDVAMTTKEEEKTPLTSRSYVAGIKADEAAKSMGTPGNKKSTED